MKLKYIIPAILLAVFSTACSDDDEKTQPKAQIEVDSNLLEVNQSVTLHFTGEADNVVVFPGDEGQDYELVAEGNSGLVVNKGLFTYSYTHPGAYHIVCVATNHYDEGTVLMTDTCSVWVRVIDDVTEIDRLSAVQVLNVDEIFAELHGESDWVLGLPHKMKVGKKEANVPTKQRLSFYIPSQTTEVLIDGNTYGATTRYDLANALDITTRSNAGTERNYKLHTLQYAEFKTFELAGVKATLERSEYDYSAFAINIELPASTDLTSLAPVFTTYAANEKVYIGQTEQTSGSSAADFSKPVVYRLVTTSTENPALTVESTCTVSATLK